MPSCGTLDQWRYNIAKYTVGNNLLALCISGAFVAPLLKILGEPSRGGNLSGHSQTGKTTLIRCAMSANGPAEEEYIRTWRATANGLEAVAAENNDFLSVLDELSQANPHEAGSVVYMMGNSAGKQRAIALEARANHTIGEHFSGAQVKSSWPRNWPKRADTHAPAWMCGWLKLLRMPVVGLASGRSFLIFLQAQHFLITWARRHVHTAGLRDRRFWLALRVIAPTMRPR